MKPVLITLFREFNKKQINDFSRQSQYFKNYVLVKEKNIKKFNNDLSSKKIIFVPFKSKNDILKKIEEIFTKENNNLIFPFFEGDNNSKYAIKIYNQSFNTKIDPRLFKQKDAMNVFIFDDNFKKKSIKYTFSQIQNKKYEEIEQELGSCFIIKPTNAASSLLTFKIDNAKKFIQIKQKIKKKYNYILEQYLNGNLYAIDFYCDANDIFLLCFTREIPMAELLEKFSSKYMEKYNKNLNEDFLHFLPIRYTIPLEKLNSLEKQFINCIKEKFIEKQYRGFIHLEYKISKIEKKIGFIEMGARKGWQRGTFIHKMHNLFVENLPLEILYQKDFSRFSFKDNLYFLKNKNIDKNFIGIKTNVLQKTHIIEIFKKIPNFLNLSFAEFLQNFLWDKWKIKVKKIKFFTKYSSDYCIYPFYERNDTRFNYIIELDEYSFKRFLNKKHTILEKLVFHDYK